MLRKFISIKNVGRFLNYNASGDVELKCYNLIFAENGRGKTTLSAILRSLQSGDPAHTTGRTTLGTTEAPEINILLQSGNALFGKGAWNTTVPGITIFDSTFVSENVYSGDTVGLEHRRSLYRLIVGRQGVVLAQEIDLLDDDSRAKSTEIREKGAAVHAYVPQGMAIDTFLAIEEDPAIDEKIAAREKELEAVRQAERINTRAALTPLTLPAVSSGFESLLGKTIEDVSADAERRVAAQIERHAMHTRGEAWLSEGLTYVRNNACPFCSQSLGAVSDLMAAYRAFFGQAYIALHDEITAMRAQIESAFGDRAIGALERVIEQNNAAVEFWTRYCDITPPDPAELERAGEALRTLRQRALALLDRKAAAPLEPVAADAAFSSAQAALLAVRQAASSYNRAVAATNAIIEAKKVATGASNVASVQSALNALRATRKRHQPEVKKACEAYQTAETDKKTIEASKAAVRKQLDEHTAQVIGRYEQTINQYLDDFHAGFRIVGVRHGYAGGAATSSYQILINSTPVELGDSTTPLDVPSFRNTLSAGDRSTLALAFFLAQLDHDPEKASKIVIFDDPFNSQDRFRKECTVQKIKRCGDICTQVIVLSHDRNFLKRIWDRLQMQSADRKYLEMSRIGERDTTIRAEDIEKVMQVRYREDLKTLADYCLAGEGKPRDVVQKLRPVLETYCKSLGAGSLADSDTLGTIVGKIRAVGAGHQLFPLCDGLEELNEYTKRYHHGENPHAATEDISDAELQGYVRRTLAMTGGC